MSLTTFKRWLKRRWEPQGSRSRGQSEVAFGEGRGLASVAVREFEPSPDLTLKDYGEAFQSARGRRLGDDNEPQHRLPTRLVVQRLRTCEHHCEP